MVALNEAISARADAKPSEVAVIARQMEGVTIDRKERLVHGTVATLGLATDNMVWLVHQFDFSYFPTSVRAVYLNHNYADLPIGTCRNMTMKEDGSIYSTTHITERAIGDEVMTMIEEGALRGKSLGIRIVDMGVPTPQEMDRYPQARNASAVVRKAMALEYSLTAMPADQACLMDLATRGVIRRATAVALGLKDSPIRKVYPTQGPCRVYRIAN